MKKTTLKLAALVCSLLLLVSVGFAEKGNKVPLRDSPSEEKVKEPLKAEKTKPQETGGSETSDEKAQPVPQTRQAELQSAPVHPAPVIQPAEIRQPEAQPAPAFWEKGRNIKWNVFGAGGGASSWSKGHQLRQTVGQTAAGCVSSGSHQASQGFQIGACGGEEFLRGDANNDGLIDLGDVIYILNYLFKHGPYPIPMEAGDANCDDKVDMGDAIYVLNYLFKHGPPPGC